MLCAPWSMPRAAGLVSLSAGHKAITFSKGELPVFSKDRFTCDTHIYMADQNYSPVTHGLYQIKAASFGVFNACYMPLLYKVTLRDKRVVAIFRSSQQPHTKVAFVLIGTALSTLRAGSYMLSSGTALTIDEAHRVTSAIQP